MRTTLDLDDDVLQATHEHAAACRMQKASSRAGARRAAEPDAESSAPRRCLLAL